MVVQWTEVHYMAEAPRGFGLQPARWNPRGGRCHLPYRPLPQQFRQQLACPILSLFGAPWGVVVVERRGGSAEGELHSFGNPLLQQWASPGFSPKSQSGSNLALEPITTPSASWRGLKVRTPSWGGVWKSIMCGCKLNTLCLSLTPATRQT